MPALMVQNHPHSTLASFRGTPVRCPSIPLMSWNLRQTRRGSGGLIAGNFGASGQSYFAKTRRLTHRPVTEAMIERAHESDPQQTGIPEGLPASNQVNTIICDGFSRWSAEHAILRCDLIGFFSRIQIDAALLPSASPNPFLSSESPGFGNEAR